MHLALSAGRLGLTVGLGELLDLAGSSGFSGVEPDSSAFFAATATDRDEFTASLRERRFDWRLSALPGALGTTASDDEFDRLLAEVGRRAPVLADAGVVALSTWIAPANDDAPFGEVLRLHRRRLDRLAPVLRAHGLRLALEYVGPATWRRGRRYEFIHTLRGMLELIEDVRDPDRFGLLLDTFHWHTAHETPGDLRSLSAGDVLGVDLNDAVIDRAIDEQVDLERELPGETKIIDSSGFLHALRDIGYSGPVFAEPFGTANDVLPVGVRVANAHTALHRVFVGAALAPS